MLSRLAQRIPVSRGLRPRKSHSSSHSTTLVLRTLSASAKNDHIAAPKKSLVTQEEGVHQTMKISKSWRNKPLFRRQGDVRFKTGMEASSLLVREALRRDSDESEYIDSVTSTMDCLAPIFDRNPKYAFAAKTLMEPERFLQFRVAWIDDVGVNRLNRGYRVQYSSSLGPYAGSLHFGSHISHSVVHALAFDAVFGNAVTGLDYGAAVGGSDFNPLDKSEAELQRFCQSFMTELSKYVGPDQDIPWMGMGVGREEMGYLFGQYKRLQPRQGGQALAAMVTQDSAPGLGIAHFADEMMKKKGTLSGKRVLFVGGGKVARSAANKFLDYGAIPITMSDASGHIYEPDGFSKSKLKTIDSIKSERGALLGRYIISSTTAKFNHPENLWEIPCDICVPCGAMNEIDEAQANLLADGGCKLVVEGGQGCVTAAARKVLKKRGVQYAPHTMTLAGTAIMHALGPKATDEQLKTEVARMYAEIKNTASEFNQRGDLLAGAKIAGFLRVANVMMMHGAV